MNRLLAMLVMGVVVTIGISFFVIAMGALDGGVSMAGSAYEDQYDSVTEISILSIILLKGLPIIIGVCILLIGVVGLKKYARV